jgi:hypothetical protein
MNRQDWVFVGIRLLGVFLLVQGVVALPMLVDCNPNVKADTPRILDPILRILIGLFLAIRSDRICTLLGDRSSSR